MGEIALGRPLYIKMRLLCCIQLVITGFPYNNDTATSCVRESYHRNNILKQMHLVKASVSAIDLLISISGSFL